METATNDLAETRADIARLAQAVITRQLEYRQARGSIEEALERDAIRASSLSRDPGTSSDSGLVLVAPCAGTMLRLRVECARGGGARGRYPGRGGLPGRAAAGRADAARRPACRWCSAGRG